MLILTKTAYPIHVSSDFKNDIFKTIGVKKQHTNIRLFYNINDNFFYDIIQPRNCLTVVFVFNHRVMYLKISSLFAWF
jgi:hypothetical protein